MTKKLFRLSAHSGAGLSLLIASALVICSCSKKDNAAGTSASSGKNSTQKVVRINYQTGTLCAAPVHIAMKKGLFEEELAKIGHKAE